MSITITILSDGKPLSGLYEILSVDILKEVNRIPLARVIFLDGDAAKQEFPLSNETFFEPGKKIEIKLRRDDETDQTVFLGLVVRHAVEANGGNTYLRVEVQDPAIRLTGERKSLVYKASSDTDIIKDKVKGAGLKAGEIADSKPEHVEIVQYYATDWDFILSRADVQGLLVIADDGTISVTKMSIEGGTKHSFEWGIDEIYDFEMEVDGGHQYKAIESIAWDVKTQKPTEPAAAKSASLAPGNLTGSQIAGALGFDSYTLSHPVPVVKDELQAWADARMARSRMALVRGRIKVPGFAPVKLMDSLELKGIGDRFNGTAAITAVRHEVNQQGWTTDLQFGLNPNWFCHTENISEAGASGILPPVHGLQVGIVDSFEEDPDKEFRVKVILPGIDPKKGTIWARLACPQAGKERGYVFRPEAGDEVAVGFFNNDPRHAVILGAMFSSKNTIPADLTPDADNLMKGIVTKSGATIGFMDDEKAAVFIETAASNKIVLDDDGEMITLADQHGNTVTMDKNGITVKSAKDLILDGSSGNVEIKGSKVDIK